MFKKDEDAALGIGAMIVFIAFVLVAIIMVSILISVTEKLAQKPPDAGFDVLPGTGNRIDIIDITIDDENADEYTFIMAYHSADEEVLSFTDVQVLMMCDDGAGGIHEYGSTLNGMVGGDSLDLSDGSTTNTFVDGGLYLIDLDQGLGGSNDCGPSDLRNSGVDIVEFFFFVQGGATTHERLDIINLGANEEVS